MGGRPLPLLGRFHEFSVAVDDVRAAVEFYERLGFSHATTTDTYSHPYGVLTDGSIFIGLHQRATPSPVLTFVRSGVAGGVAELAAAGIELSVCRTGEEVFNEIAFSDPDGHAVAVLEARTYSPVVRGEHEPSLCGNFAEVSLPVADFAVAQAFWEGLGLVAAPEEQAPYPHLPLTSDYLEVSLHRAAFCARPMLVFRDAEMAVRIARLRERGIAFAAAPRALPPGCALLAGPDGTPLLLLPEPG
jgi:catechol 2,3-dioxygenase-like lactoylglutathione lyase family enzyme